jgi:hypothetical protein
MLLYIITYNHYAITHYPTHIYIYITIWLYSGIKSHSSPVQERGTFGERLGPQSLVNSSAWMVSDEQIIPYTHLLVALSWFVIQLWFMANIFWGDGIYKPTCSWGPWHKNSGGFMSFIGDDLRKHLGVLEMNHRKPWYEGFQSHGGTPKSSSGW